MGINGSRDLGALRAHLKEARTENARAMYQRALDENRATIEAIRAEWTPTRKSAGGNMPDDTVDAQIAALEASLDATANRLRTALGL